MISAGDLNYRDSRTNSRLEMTSFSRDTIYHHEGNILTSKPMTLNRMFAIENSEMVVRKGLAVVLTVGDCVTVKSLNKQVRRADGRPHFFGAFSSA